GLRHYCLARDGPTGIGSKPTEDLLPLTIDIVTGGLQIHPHKEFDPDWHVRFNCLVIRAGCPTILEAYE
ncbi:MAG: hypothetical protein V4724_16295, partial [Pseudomonadota bacterium]